MQVFPNSPSVVGSLWAFDILTVYVLNLRHGNNAHKITMLGIPPNIVHCTYFLMNWSLKSLKCKRGCVQQIWLYVCITTCFMKDNHATQRQFPISNFNPIQTGLFWSSGTWRNSAPSLLNSEKIKAMTTKIKGRLTRSKCFLRSPQK